MPTREVLTEELIEEFKRVLERTYIDFKRFPCESTVSMLIVRLYEVAISVYSFEYSDKKIANYKDVKNNLTNCDNPLVFVGLRDNLIHNLNQIKNHKESIMYTLIAFGKENFNAVVTKCLTRNNDLYTEIMNYCNTNNSTEALTSF